MKEKIKEKVLEKLGMPLPEHKLWEKCSCKECAVYRGYHRVCELTQKETSKQIFDDIEKNIRCGYPDGNINEEWYVLELYMTWEELKKKWLK